MPVERERYCTAKKWVSETVYEAVQAAIQFIQLFAESVDQFDFAIIDQNDWMYLKKRRKNMVLNETNEHSHFLKGVPTKSSSLLILFFFLLVLIRR